MSIPPPSARQTPTITQYPQQQKTPGVAGQDRTLVNQTTLVPGQTSNTALKKRRIIAIQENGQNTEATNDKKRRLDEQTNPTLDSDNNTTTVQREDVTEHVKSPLDGLLWRLPRFQQDASNDGKSPRLYQGKERTQ
jgi:hypothetical protein